MVGSDDQAVQEEREIVMSDLISKGAVLDRLEMLRKNYTLRAGYRDAVTDAIGEVRDALTIDAEPVRHGRWIYRKTIPGFHKCSICGVTNKMQVSCNKYVMLRYCPNCGARMDSEANEKD